MSIRHLQTDFTVVWKKNLPTKEIGVKDQIKDAFSEEN